MSGEIPIAMPILFAFLNTMGTCQVTDDKLMIPDEWDFIHCSYYWYHLL